MARYVCCLGLCALATACFSPEEDPLDLDSDSAGTETTSGTTTDDPSMTTTTMTSSDPTGPSTTESGGDPVCGDGEVNGDETCDDGINDGSYGGCLEDCSGPAAFCGDAEVNGDETCDDGVNDGAYGGCTDTCQFAAFCGDGDVNGDEGCDEGTDNNVNGEGCNADCVVSGSEIGEYNRDNLDYCEGANLMEPQYNTMGHTYIAVGAQCNDDSWLLLEFDADANLTAEHQDGLTLPNINFQEFTARGDTWLLSTYACNFVIEQDGTLSAEVCSAQQSDRYQGDAALEARDADVYLAMDGDDNIAVYGATSPMDGDTPNPLIVPNTTTGNWYFYDAIWGHNGTIVQAGQYQFDFQSELQARVFQYTAAGNVANQGYHNDVEGYTSIVRSPDGGYVVHASQPNYVMRKLNANLSVAWTQPIPNASGTVQFDVDSENKIVMAYRDANSEWHLEKWSANGQTSFYDHVIDDWSGFSVELSVAPDDSTWVVHQFQNITMQLDVLHFAP